jgi:hypothetical protein
MRTDEERFNWLLEEYKLNGTIEFEKTTEYSHTPNACQLFTISSQHVYGKTFREAIDAAMIKEKRQ